MKNGLFCLALASGLQCFSMQPEENLSFEERPVVYPMSEDRKEMIRQQLEAMQERMTRGFASFVISRPRPLPDPGVAGLCEWTFREFRSWVYANLFRLSKTDIKNVLLIIYSNMNEALHRVGDSYIPLLPHEEMLLQNTFIPVRPLPPDEINSIGEKYHKLAEDCLMTMIEQVGRSQGTQGGRYLLAALKRLFFLRFHPEMIGKEFRPGYLRPGDDPEVMCRGGYGTWCRREYD